MTVAIKLLLTEHCMLAQAAGDYSMKTLFVQFTQNMNSNQGPGGSNHACFC
jgi:hypothetical protein